MKYTSNMSLVLSSLSMCYPHPKWGSVGLRKVTYLRFENQSTKFSIWRMYILYHKMWVKFHWRLNVVFLWLLAPTQMGITVRAHVTIRLRMTTEGRQLSKLFHMNNALLKEVLWLSCAGEELARQTECHYRNNRNTNRHHTDSLTSSLFSWEWSISLGKERERK